MEVDVMDSTTITSEADNRNTTDNGTTTTTTGPTFHQLSDASMEMVASATTMGMVAVTVVALDSYAVLPGIRPSSALRHRSIRNPP
jgi:hypothetical protein